MGRCSLGVPTWRGGDEALAQHAPGGLPRRPYQWRRLSLRARAPEQHSTTPSRSTFTDLHAHLVTSNLSRIRKPTEAATRPKGSMVCGKSSSDDSWTVHMDSMLLYLMLQSVASAGNSAPELCLIAIQYTAGTTRF